MPDPISATTEIARPKTQNAGVRIASVGVKPSRLPAELPAASGTSEHLPTTGGSRVRIRARGAIPASRIHPMSPQRTRQSSLLYVLAHVAAIPNPDESKSV